MIRGRFLILSVAGLLIGLNANAQFITERSEALDAGDAGDHVSGQWSACDAITGQAVEASWHIRGLDPRKSSVFHESALHHLLLTPWREYDRVVEAHGYMVAADNYWIEEASEARDTVFLEPLQKGVRQELPTIHFAGSQITYDALPTLAAIERMLSIHPELELDIIGAVGQDPRSELKESIEPCARRGRARARAVWEYLVTEGIHPGRLVVSGVSCSERGDPDDLPVEAAAARPRIAVEVLVY